MIKDPSYIRRFNDHLARSKGRPDYNRVIGLIDALWEEGRSLGALPPADPLNGIETDIQLARILNSCSKNSSPD